MIIGIDVSSLPYGTGVSNYTLNLVKNLIKIDRRHHYKLFFSSLRQPLPRDLILLKKNPRVKIYRFRIPPTILEFLWNRLHILPIELFIGKCDIFHTWDWTQPPTLKAKSVTTIHDFVPLLFPQTQHPKTIAVFKRKLALAARETSLFICVSKNTLNDLIRLFPHIPPNKTTVIYEAAENKYDAFYHLSPNQKTKKISVINRQYGLHKFFLAQGTREPRKNLTRLIEAFLLFKKKYPSSKYELAITGKYGWGEDITKPTDNSVKILGYIPEKDLVALHASAVCLIFPSLYEGFGLPIIKSMKVGTPVITSNLSSLPEIAGSAAIYVNPTSVSDITRAISKIAQSSAVRQQLTKKGLVQAGKFSWETTARQTLFAYEKILSSPR